MNTMIRSLAALTALTVCAAPQAAETLSTMSVAMTVPASCTVSTTPMSFGTQTGATSVTAQSTILVSCPSRLLYNVAIDGGQNLFGRRQMANGSGGFVSYRLTKTASGLDWGDSDFANRFPNGSSVAATGSGATQSLTVFGETIGSTSVPAGSYTDSVVVTVHY